MTVYSVKITESQEQLIEGVPRSITVTPNVPSVVFYSFTGQANAASTIYVSGINMPTQTPVKLSIFASNGTDTFSVNYVYRNSSISAQDYPAEVTQYSGNPYPFGDMNSAGQIGPPAFPISGGNPIYTPYDTVGIPSGYNADGYGTGFTNKPYEQLNYLVKAEYYNKNGLPIIGVGFVPAKSKILTPKKPPVESHTHDLFFDPRAMVIFQDASKEDPTAPPLINKMQFSLPLSNYNEELKDFKKYYRTGLESQNTGSFVRQLFNPRDNTLNYYYHDARTNRWIISKVPYTPGKLTYTNDYSVGSPFTVYRWIPNFSRRTNLA